MREDDDERMNERSVQQSDTPGPTAPHDLTEKAHRQPATTKDALTENENPTVQQDFDLYPESEDSLPDLGQEKIDASEISDYLPATSSLPRLARNAELLAERASEAAALRKMFEEAKIAPIVSAQGVLTIDFLLNVTGGARWLVFESFRKKLPQYPHIISEIIKYYDWEIGAYIFPEHPYFWIRSLASLMARRPNFWEFTSRRNIISDLWTLYFPTDDTLECKNRSEWVSFWVKIADTHQLLGTLGHSAKHYFALLVRNCLVTDDASFSSLNNEYKHSTKQTADRGLLAYWDFILEEAISTARKENKCLPNSVGAWQANIMGGDDDDEEQATRDAYNLVCGLINSHIMPLSKDEIGKIAASIRVMQKSPPATQQGKKDFVDKTNFLLDTYSLRIFVNSKPCRLHMSKGGSKNGYIALSGGGPSGSFGGFSEAIFTIVEVPSNFQGARKTPSNTPAIPRP